MKRARLFFVFLIALCSVLSLALLLMRAATPKAWCKGCDIVIISLESVSAAEAMLLQEETPMPRLSAFAGARAVVFTSAYAQAPWSLPAHAALFTGAYPWELGVWEGTDALPSDVPTLAGSLREEGYATFLYSDGFVRPEFGFGTGFDSVTGSLVASPGSARSLFTAAAQLLAASSSEPRFVVIHPDEVRLPYGSFDSVALSRLHGKESGPTEEEADAARGAYRTELRALDTLLGDFLDALNESGAIERTVLVVTSGNGTRFAVPRELGLSQSSLSDESLRVPFILAVPGIEAGTIAASVETRSLARTLLEGTGIAAPRLPGLSLVPLLQGEPVDQLVRAATAKDAGEALAGLAVTEERLARIASGEELAVPRRIPYSGPFGQMVLRGPWKLESLSDGTRMIRNLAADPHETRNYAEALPAPPAYAIAELVAALFVR